MPSTSCTSRTLSAWVAGPLITAPVAMSNREPWHWHMIVVPVSKPPRLPWLPIKAAGTLPLQPEAELQWWYQYYFATERGRARCEKYRHEFAKLIWRTASPGWNFDDATFERSAASFDNPDHVAIVIDNYRWRLGLDRRRIRVPRSRGAARPGPCHHRPGDHARGRRKRRAPPGTGRVRGRSSSGRTRTGRSRVASDTTFPRKLRTRSPPPSANLLTCDERVRITSQ